MCCYTTNQVQSLLFFHLAIVIAIHSPEVSQEGDHNGLILCPERNSLSLAIHGEEGDSSQGVATNADGGDRIGGGGGGGRGEGKFLVGFFLVDDAGQRRRRAAASRGAKTRHLVTGHRRCGGGDAGGSHGVGVVWRRGGRGGRGGVSERNGFLEQLV
jgi:hypothetical protein